MYYKVTFWKNVNKNEDTKTHFKEITSFAEKAGFGLIDYHITPETASAYAPQQEEEVQEPKGEPQ